MSQNRVVSRRLLWGLSTGLVIMIAGWVVIGTWSAFAVDTFEARVTTCERGREGNYHCSGTWRDPRDGVERTGAVSGASPYSDSAEGQVVPVRATRHATVVQRWDAPVRALWRAVPAVAAGVVGAVVLVVIASARRP